MDFGPFGDVLVDGVGQDLTVDDHGCAFPQPLPETGEPLIQLLDEGTDRAGLDLHLGHAIGEVTQRSGKVDPSH